MQSLPESSAEELQKKITTGSRNHEDYCNLAALLARAGQYDEALSLYERTLSLPLTAFAQASVLMEMGWWALEFGQRTKALTLAERAITLLKGSSTTEKELFAQGESHVLRAHCVAFMDAKAGIEAAQVARQWLEQLVSKYPNWDRIGEAYYRFAHLSILLRNMKEAITLCKKALQYQLDKTDRLSCLIILEEAFRREGQFAEAERTINDALHLLEGREENSSAQMKLHFDRGKIEHATGQFLQARNTLQQVLTWITVDSGLHKNPYLLGELYWYIGMVSYDLHEYSEAAAAMQKSHACFPKQDANYWSALLWLGHCYTEIGEVNKARTCYEQVLASPQALDQEKAGAEKRVAQLDFEAGNYQDAAAAFQRMLAHEANDSSSYWNALLWLGHCHEATGAYDKARGGFMKVIAAQHALEADKASAQEGLLRLPSKEAGSA